jgi:hypothetical protein
MNGLIKQSKLDSVNLVGSLAIALFSVATLVYGFTNGMAA